MMLKYNIKLLFLSVSISFLSANLIAQEPVAVVAVPVVQKEIFDKVEALGTLQANESVSLTATVTKTITAIHFQDGQRVEKGDLLIEMTSSEEHALLREARATLSEARQQFERLQPLQERGAAPLSVLDEKKREFETAKARLQVIESRLADLIINAPFSGIVGLRNISVGALVSPGEIVTTLDDDSVMKLNFAVPITFLSELREGLAVSATSIAFPGKSFTGNVASIDSRIDPVTRAIQVRALLQNSERLLRPGLLMTVTLQQNPRTALLIAEEALMPLGRKNSVYVAEAKDDVHEVRQQEIEIGARQAGLVEVLSGLKAGELIVSHGALKIRPGSKVLIKNSLAAAFAKQKD